MITRSTRRSRRTSNPRDTSMSETLPAVVGGHTLMELTTTSLVIEEVNLTTTGGTADVALTVDGETVTGTSTTIDETDTTIALEEPVPASSDIVLDVSDGTDLAGIEVDLSWSL